MSFSLTQQRTLLYFEHSRAINSFIHQTRECTLVSGLSLSSASANTCYS